jgi:hypothetical protein
MAIKGLTAFRTNKFDGKRIVSPLHNSFVWERQTTWSKPCLMGCPQVIPNPDEPEIKILNPGMDCHCGIYATLTKDEISDYMVEYQEGVLCLVEAVGNYVVHYNKPNDWDEQPEGGFRASGVQIVGIVNSSPNKKRHIIPGAEFVLDRKSALISSAAEYFHVPVLEYDQAIEISKIMWEKICPELPWIFNLEALYATAS